MSSATTHRAGSASLAPHDATSDPRIGPIEREAAGRARLHIRLREWESWAPQPGGDGWEVFLDEGGRARQTARELTRQGRLSVVETRRGLEVEAASHVGRIQLDDVTITVQPKLRGLPLWSLMRFAFDLRALHQYDDAAYEAEPDAFQDVVIARLADEAAELIARGLHRTYNTREEELTSPRGRIDFIALAHRTTPTAELPCRYHVRSEDCLVNQVLRAGLALGARLATDAELSVICRRLEAQLGEEVDLISLDGATFTRLVAAQSRLTRAYRPALELVHLLADSSGAGLEDEEVGAGWLPGFLFDMNHFFERLVSRFLHEALPGYTVTDQERIHGMMRYAQAHNPRGKRSPEPRPDFIVRRRGEVVAVLDAKYRDLWEQDLPRDMLYQLAIYALSREASDGAAAAPAVGTASIAAILYPTLASGAREARIEIRDPVRGRERAAVVLRPVDMNELSRLVGLPPTAAAIDAQRRFALQMCFGRSR